MEYRKSFFGKTIIDRSDSEELNENEKIELEYYETHNLAEKNERKYGIEIVKTKEKKKIRDKNRWSWYISVPVFIRFAKLYIKNTKNLRIFIIKT